MYLAPLLVLLLVPRSILFNTFQAYFLHLSVLFLIFAL